MKLDGGTWVDIFAVVFIVRLVAPLFHGMPPLTVSEAGIWGTTIGAFAYSNQGPKPS